MIDSSEGENGARQQATSVPKNSKLWLYFACTWLLLIKVDINNGLGRLHGCKWKHDILIYRLDSIAAGDTIKG